ncbi:MAG: hypothetical protein JRN11_00110 [Nitrososphaerota archaeon]|nr:hypothetical protein [Nitrososphaerota archaeon]MDG7025141.1 hypothetical protein [Nitrososphaerota archaeon]
MSGTGNKGIVVVQLLPLATFEVSPLSGTIVGAVATYPVAYVISIKYVWKANPPR